MTMRRRDAGELVALGALWGASFLFMRIGAPEFGPLPLVFLRVGLATLPLLALLAWRGQLAALRQHAWPLVVVGIGNSALPFTLFTLGALALQAGLLGIFNATAPLWAAVIAWAWLGERPAPSRLLGLALGFAGVLYLGWDSASLKPGEHGISPALAIGAAVAATFCYGWTVNYTRQRLAGVPPLVVAAGSQLAAAVAVAPAALWLWPAAAPSGRAWTAAVVLALACTGLAYLLYFRLIAQLGAAQAIAVTYLIPLFAMAWGWLVLGETVTLPMAIGGTVVLLGTALATGFVGGRRSA